MNYNEEISHMYGKLEGLKVAYDYFMLGQFGPEKYHELEKGYKEIIGKLRKHG